MRSACWKWLARGAAPVVLISLTPACGVEHDPMEKQLKKLQDDIARIQSETDRMGERMDAMEVRQASAPKGSDERFSAGNSSSSTLSRPKLKVVRVEPGSELVSEGADGDQGYADADNAPRVVIQGEGKSLETRTLPAPTAAKSAPPATKPTKSDKEGAKSPKADSASSK
jgi:hypothetical protein